MKDKNLIGAIFLTSTAAIWGISYIFTKIAVESIPPMTLASMRFLIASMILFLFVGKKRGFTLLKSKGAMLSGLFGVALYFFFENYSLKLTNPSDAALIVSSAPILAIIFYDILERRFNIIEYIGSISAFTGLFFIIYGGQFNEGSSIFGNIIAFGAAISWVGYTYFFEKNSDSTTTGTFAISLWGMIFAIPFAIIELFIFKMPISFNPGSITGILYLSILASALGYFMWGMGIKFWGGKYSTIWIYTIPIFTVFADIVFLNNIPTFFFYLGASLVATGMILVIIHRLKNIRGYKESFSNQYRR
ncbi:MAG: DMT family transporter [Kosmotogaceae bacterium]